MGEQWVKNRTEHIRRRSDQRMAISHWKSPPVAHNLCCYRALHTTTTRTTSSTLSLSQRPLRYSLSLSLSLSLSEEEEEDMKIKGSLVDVDMQWWALVLLGSPLLGTY